MSAPTNASDFFVAGGTLRADARSYVERPADDELFDLALAGKFCYVLTPRQMGKSSLMVRTARRLEERGARTAIVDLARISTGVTVEQWYLGLIAPLKSQLGLSVDSEAWWAERACFSEVQRFTDFLHDVVLAEIEGPVVIFIDEIDTTLSLDFSDDFFAAIRFTYNARASDPVYNRLTFVLLGTAAPADLIKDPGRTPFNIGQGIDLREFSREDAQVLQAGLKAILPEWGEAVFARIYHWTNGHPYLTQKLCLAAAEAGDGRWTDERVDGLVESLFLSEEARNETNLQFVRAKILNHPQRRQLLALYRKIYGRRRIGEDNRSLIQNQLKLSGLVKAEGGYLHVRNEIYRRAFSPAWVRENITINRAYIVAGVAVLAALVAVGSNFYDEIACRWWPRERWCSQNSRALEGKTVFALANCENGTLFAGAEDGIYRRAPGNKEWELEKSTNSEVRGLVASPDCKTAYAAIPDYGILRRDKGSWSVVSRPDMDQAWAVTLSGDMILGGGEFGVCESATSATHHWESPGAHLDNSFVVSLARSDGRIYAVVWDGEVWYCSEDHPHQWWPVNDGLETANPLRTVGSPIDGVPGFVGVDDGFYRWNGIRWERGAGPWGNTRTFWFVIDGTTVYASQEDAGVLRSTDSGLTWEQMNTGWRKPPFRVRTLLIHVDDEDRRWLYAGTSEGVWHYLLPMPFAGICNGDFERNFECWQHGGELAQAIECDGDQCYAVLGDPGYVCYGGVPVGEAWMKQSFQVPDTISPTLSLRYQVFSQDLDYSDFFQVSINGGILGQFGNTEWDVSSCDREVWDSGWQTVEFDLSPYSGERVELSLRNVNGTHEWWNTWTYVDDVEIR